MFVPIDRPLPTASLSPIYHKAGLEANKKPMTNQSCNQGLKRTKRSFTFELRGNDKIFPTCVYYYDYNRG